MSTQPVLPLFVGDYLADTQHLTMEESGTYLHLLMAMWVRNGSVPNVDRELARMFRLTVRRWCKIKRRLMPFLIEENGCLTQGRLRKEWDRIHGGVQNRTLFDSKRNPKKIQNASKHASFREGQIEENQPLNPSLARGRARAFQSNPIKDKSEPLLKGGSSYPIASDPLERAASAREAKRHAAWLHKIAERNRPADPNHPTLLEAEAEQVEVYRRAKRLRERLKAAGFKGLRIIPP